MSQQNDYFGYVPSNSRIDWGKMTGDIADELTQAYQNRELARQQLDDIKTANDNLVSSTEKGKTQVLNDLVLSGVDDARNKTLQWNKDLKSGLLSARDYKAKMNKLKDNWTIFANNMKQFDTRMQEALKRQQVGEDGKTEGSTVEAAINEQIAALGDLRNKKITIDENTGTVYMGAVNPDTGVYDPNTLIDATSIGNVTNTYDNRLDLISAVDPYVKLVKAWKEETPNGTITDARRNPAIANSINNFKSGLLSNNRAATSVLLDNADLGYDTYFNEDQLNQKVSQKLEAEIRSISEMPAYSSQEIIDKVEKYKQKNKKATDEDLEKYKVKLENQSMEPLTDEEVADLEQDIRSKMILIQLDENGIYQPTLNSDQIKDADAVIEDLIYTGIPRTVTLPTTTKSSTGTGGKGGKGTGTGDGGGFGLYKSIYDGFNKAIQVSDNSNMGDLNALMKESFRRGGYEFQRGPNGIYVVKITPIKDAFGKVTYETNQEAGPFNMDNMNNLANYFGFAYGTGTKSNTAQEEYEAQKAAYEKAMGIIDKFNGQERTGK